MNAPRKDLTEYTDGRLTARVNALLGGQTKEKEIALDAVGNILLVAIVSMLSRPGTGKRYRRGKNVYHQASAPGEPPARDTSALVNSAQSTRQGLEVQVGVATKYAATLEYGTRNATAGGDGAVAAQEEGDTTAKKSPVILPRPYMRPALEGVKEQMTPVVLGILRRGARKGGFDMQAGGGAS